MTLIDGFDRTVKDWLHEEAEWTTPGYLDEVVAETARTRQRPAWSSLERWLPLATTARFAVFPAPRRLLALAVVAALILAAVALALIGPGRPNLPTFLAQANGRFAFMDGPNLEFAAADGSNPEAVLTLETGASGLAWSPDGTYFVYRTGGTSPSIVRVDADGSHPVTLASGSAVSDGGRIAWSPDGKQLVFNGLADNGWLRLMLVNADGSNLHELGSASAVAAGEHYDPAWSPDGQWISFLSPGAAGSVGAFLIHPDGSGVRRLEISTPGDGAPGMTWSPDPAQQRLAYGAANGSVMLFDLATSIETRVGPGFWPTWAPDGARISWWHEGTNIARVEDILARRGSPSHPFPLFSLSCGEVPELDGKVICSPAGWSPDGQWVYGIGVGGDSIVMGRSSGTSEVRVIPLSTPMDLTAGPRAEIAWQPVAP